MHYDSVCYYKKKKLQIILCITLKELGNSLIKYEYNLIVLPCPGSSFLVIKTRRVTFNVLHVHMGRFKKKQQFFSHSAQSKRKEYIGYFYGTNQKINNNNNNNHSLTTSLQLPVKHNQMEQLVNECDNYCGQSAKPVSSPAHVYISLYHANE